MYETRIAGLLARAEQAEVERDAARALLARALEALELAPMHGHDAACKLFKRSIADCDCGADAENARRDTLIAEIKGVIK